MLELGFHVLDQVLAELMRRVLVRRPGQLDRGLAHGFKGLSVVELLLLRRPWHRLPILEQLLVLVFIEIYLAHI